MLFKPGWVGVVKPQGGWDVDRASCSNAINMQWHIHHTFLLFIPLFDSIFPILLNSEKREVHLNTSFVHLLSWNWRVCFYSSFQKIVFTESISYQKDLISSTYVCCLKWKASTKAFVRQTVSVDWLFVLHVRILMFVKFLFLDLMIIFHFFQILRQKVWTNICNITNHKSVFS